MAGRQLLDGQVWGAEEALKHVYHHWMRDRSFNDSSAHCAGQVQLPPCHSSSKAPTTHHSLKHLICTLSNNAFIILIFVSREETQAQRGEGACPRSPSSYTEEPHSETKLVFFVFSHSKPRTQQGPRLGVRAAREQEGCRIKLEQDLWCREVLRNKVEAY